jgi:autotransporter-associated beta strand protein
MRAHLLATTAVVALLAATSANAQNATWSSTPGSSDYNTGSNWIPIPPTPADTVPSGTAFFGASNQTNVTFSPTITTVGGWTFNPGASAYTFANSVVLSFTGAGITVNGGSVTINNTFALLEFNNTSTAGSATINNFGGLVEFHNNSTAGTATMTTTGNQIQFLDSSTAGNATITNNSNNGAGVLFSGNSTAGSASITNNGLAIDFFANSTGGTATINNNTLLQFLDNSTGGGATITNTSAGAVVDFSGSTGPLGNNNLSVGSLAGPGKFYLGGNELTVGSNNMSTTVSGVISDCGATGAACNSRGATGGSLIKVGAGVLTLTGANTYNGPTTVNAGTLIVNGSIAPSRLTTVNSGGTLGGTGTVGNTQINSGGVFAPGSVTAGTSMAVAGNLAFQSGALYLVQVNSSTASLANVTGTASLAGTVDANVASGSFTSIKTYDILHSSGLGDTTFKGLIVSNPNLGASLTYSGTDVFLTLRAALGGGSNLNENQQNVANALNNFVNGGGTLPPGFASLFGLTGGTLANALSQLDGEVATGAERAAIQLTNSFLTLLTDPIGCGGANASAVSPYACDRGRSALPFAPEAEASLPPDIALAYASIFKAPPKPLFEQQWSTWGSAYGGSNISNGNATVGSNNVTTNIFGFAAGMDYSLTPDLLAGFALAGAGTNWGLANGLGTGRSDAFQVGARVISWFGPAYVKAALAFTNNWFTTNRSALGDQLTANFIGQSYGARLEGGYRVAVLPAVGVTPYGAVQFQDFHTPAYSETDATGGGFGLSYNAMNATDTRTELGARFDDPTLLYGKPLILFGRLAWAHDFVNNPALSAAFQALPGGTFTVFGAPIPQNSALTTAGAQLFLTPQWTLLAKFEGEFASGSQTYAGTGTLRYTW